MSKTWKAFAISALVLSLVSVGTVLTAQEHQNVAAQEETDHHMDSNHAMGSGHDMGAMMVMMKQMMANMHEHMAMMHTALAGKHGDVHTTHGEGMHDEHGNVHAKPSEGMPAEHGNKSMNKMKGGDMHAMESPSGEGMMRMLDPSGIADAATATAEADKVAEHLDMMKKMMPKLEAQLEALRKRAEELSADQS